MTISALVMPLAWPGRGRAGRGHHAGMRTDLVTAAGGKRLPGRAGPVAGCSPWMPASGTGCAPRSIPPPTATIRPGPTTRRRCTTRWPAPPRLGPADRLLEIGCATGKATLPLARRGLAITCLEPGPELAAAARRNLADFPAVRVVTTDFETWAAPPGSGSTWSSRRPRGTGSTRRSASAGPSSCWRPAATWPSGPRATSSPTAATRSSTRSSRCTTRSARACRPASSAPGPASCPTSCPPRSRPAACSATSSSSSSTGRSATTRTGYLALLDTFSGHIADGAVAAGPAVRRDPPPPGAAPRGAIAPALGRYPAHRAPPRRRPVLSAT